MQDITDSILILIMVTLYTIPGTYSLSGLNQISATSFQGVTFGNSGQNAYGARFISTQDPTGGVDGDIWYKI